MKNNVRQGLNFGVTRRGSLRSRAPCASLESFSVEKLKSCVCACVCVCVCVCLCLCVIKRWEGALNCVHWGTEFLSWVQRPHRTRLFLTHVKIDTRQKHLPRYIFNETGHTGASIVMHGSGTSLQTLGSLSETCFFMKRQRQHRNFNAKRGKLRC